MAAATQLRYHNGNGAYLGRAPATCSLLSSAPTESQPGQSMSCLGEDGLLHLTQSQQHTSRRRGEARRKQPAAAADASAATGVGTGQGGLFEGLDAAAAAAAAAEKHQPQSLRAAAAVQPSHSQLQAQRIKRKSLSPLPEDDTKILHYQAIDRIGQGGLATVFLAQDVRSGELVALKVGTKPLHVLQEGQGAEFIQSQQFSANLHQQSWDYRCFCSEQSTFVKLGCCNNDLALAHGMPKLLDAGLVILSQTRVHSFLAMNLLGRTVYDEIQDGKTSDRSHLRCLAHGMLQSLRYMHTHGFVHRDIKPGNFCLPAKPVAGSPATFIIDFGFVRSIPGHDDSLHQSFEGTPDYASINALLSHRQGPADDLESLAYSFMEMWHGDLLWDVPNQRKWSAETYQNALCKLHTPAELKTMLNVRPSQRPDVAWHEQTLAVMSELRLREWATCLEGGLVPKFLQQWVVLVRRLDPWAVPDQRVYTRLHALIDSFDVQRPSMACPSSFNQQSQPSSLLPSFVTHGHHLAPTRAVRVGQKRSRVATQIAPCYEPPPEQEEEESWSAEEEEDLGGEDEEEGWGGSDEEEHAGLEVDEQQEGAAKRTKVTAGMLLHE